MPLVSVIIPCFNGAGHIAAAIESALLQTVQDIEIIVVDDGSFDRTAQVVLPYLADTRVHYLFQQNKGLPAARNTGVRTSRSTYLAFLDADDLLVPHALEVMLYKLEATGAAWCLIDIIRRGNDVDELQHTEIPSGSELYAILRDDFIRRGMFFRRESFLAVGMYDEEMKNREDWDLNIRMFAHTMPCCYIPQPLYLYNCREGSITKNRARILNYTEALLRKHHKRLADHGDREVSTIYADLMWALARNRLYQTRDFSAAVRCVIESLRYDLNLPRLMHPLLRHSKRFLAAFPPRTPQPDV